MKNKILVMDDDQHIQDIISDLLKPKGYELFFSKNGDEGIAIALKSLPDLILLDITMPGKDGFKVQEQLKQDEKTKNIPVVFLTGRTGLTDMMQALLLGAAGYIEKPFDNKRLLRKIESLLSESTK